MPLTHIHVPNTMPCEQRAAVGDVVYQTMRDVINVPDGDKFQIINGHDPESLRMDPTYLGINRSADAFIIDITLNAGRTIEAKKQFYAALVDRLVSQVGVRAEDVLIVLTEVAKENWSFGNGVAQYAQ